MKTIHDTELADKYLNSTNLPMPMLSLQKKVRKGNNAKKKKRK